MCNKKTSTTQTTSSTASGSQTGSMTPTNPDWATNGVASLGGQISGLSNIDPYSLVAPPDQLQNMSAWGADKLGTNTGFDDASGIFRSIANNGNPMAYSAVHADPASLLQNLRSYMSPYTNDVVDTTLKGFDQNSNLTRGKQQLDLANDSTFGGSGGSILRALTEGQLSQGRAQTEATLRDQAFNTGANLSNLDAGRRQEASLFNAGADNNSRQFNAQEGDTALARMLAAAQGLSSNATAQGADARANIGTQADIGSMFRDITQSHNLAPLTLLGAQAGLFSGLPLSLFHGENTNGTYTGTSNSTGTGSQTTNDPLGALGALLGAGGSLASGLGSLGLKFH